MSKPETAAQRVEYAFSYAWMSSTLSNYCRAVDTHSTEDVLAVLEGASVQFRDSPATNDAADLATLYTAAFAANPYTRHQLSPLMIDGHSGHYTFEAAYLRFDTTDAPASLTAQGIYRGIYELDPTPRWLALRIAPH